MVRHEDDASRKKKKPYTKPRVEQVALRAEEAVLANCKLNSMTAGPGDWGTYCANPGGHRRCSVLGS